MISPIEHRSAKKRIELHDTLAAAWMLAHGAGRTRTASAIHGLLRSDDAAYTEAVATVVRYDREEAERITRRLQAHAAVQFMLQPTWDVRP